jgi:hypothetical protein
MYQIIQTPIFVFFPNVSRAVTDFSACLGSPTEKKEKKVSRYQVRIVLKKTSTMLV